jgi:hypothetical protein
MITSAMTYFPQVHLQAAIMRQFSNEELLKLLDLNPSNK